MYTRVAQDAAVARHSGRAKQPIPTGEKTKHKPMSWYQDYKDFVRLVTENMIDLSQWDDKVSPDGWLIRCLRFAQDLLKFALYGKMIDLGLSDDRKKSKKGSHPPRPDYEIWEKNTEGINGQLKCDLCNKVPGPRSISKLYKCTSVPCAMQNTLPWQQRNTDLRCEDDARGTGAFALSKCEDREILAEYQSELTPPNGADSRYTSGIDNDVKATLVYIDPMRIGN